MRKYIHYENGQEHKVSNYSGSITFCSEKAKLKNKEAFCHLSIYVSGSMALASFLLAQYAWEIDIDCKDFISNDCDRISPGVLSAEAATDKHYYGNQEKMGPFFLEIVDIAKKIRIMNPRHQTARPRSQFPY